MRHIDRFRLAIERHNLSQGEVLELTRERSGRCGRTILWEWQREVTPLPAYAVVCLIVALWDRGHITTKQMVESLEECVGDSQEHKPLAKYAGQKRKGSR